MTLLRGLARNRQMSENRKTRDYDGRVGETLKDKYRKWMGMTKPEELQADPASEIEILNAAEAEQGTPAMDEVGTVTQGEFDRVQQDRDQLLDRVARLQAEFDNARKREQRERQEFRDYAVSNAVEQFLPVLDNFQLALKAKGSEEQLRAGVELIMRQMEDALRTLGVQQVETVGTQFDPRVHEALGSEETNEHPDDQVLEEIRKGYRIKEKLLRPALVKVAKNHAQHEA